VFIKTDQPPHGLTDCAHEDATISLTVAVLFITTCLCLPIKPQPSCLTFKLGSKSTV